MKKPVALIVLDGWGYTENTDNAIAKANTPYFDLLWDRYPHSLLKAGEEAVGLPQGQVGNSEIGHMTIGSGKVIETDLVRISKEVDEGKFNDNRKINELIEYVREKDSVLHIMGLLGEGGVHSHQKHINAAISLAKEKGVKVALHLFTDGRDSGPNDAIYELERLVNGGVEISTISGRYYAMDRDNNWDRLDLFLDLLKEGDKEVKDPLEEVKRQYAEDISDEHILPFVVNDAPLRENDAVFVMNFRADRVRMLVSKLIEMKIKTLTLTEYSADFDVEVAYEPVSINHTLASVISENGISQLHVAETEKFPHATYFLNGGKEDPHHLEEHIVIPSRKDVRTHDEAPEMRAEEIADTVISKLEEGVQFVFINFANPDMVGHTANVPAIIKAVEKVDIELKRVVEKILELGGVAVVTADHGNAELNVDPETGEKHTAHTLNLVPFIITDDVNLKDGSLKDITPTIFDLMNLTKPDEMIGESLLA